MKTLKKNAYKIYFFFMNFSIYIILFLSKQPKGQIKKYKMNLVKRINSDKIIYQGEKIIKAKLIDDNLSKISDDYLSEKIEERKQFYNYYNLANYINEPEIKEELKSLFLQEVSKIKKRAIDKIDIFFLSQILNFGNNLLALNHAIFYCEIVGCHKVILNKFQLERRWFIMKPIYNAWIKC